MDKLKPLGIDGGPGKVLVLIQGVELLKDCIPKVPATQEIWNGVGDPQDMMCSDSGIMQAGKKSYFPEAHIDKWVLGATSVNGQNCHHIIKAHHKLGVTNQVRPCLEYHDKCQQFKVGNDVDLCTMNCGNGA